MTEATRKGWAAQGWGAPGDGIRPDLKLVADMVEPGSRVLDVGCGDGALLSYLAETKGVDGRGIELSQDGVHSCVSRGLSVVQGDADADLKDYPDDAFDYAILSQTLQATRSPKTVLAHLARIGRRAVVSFPNFGYWRVRASLALEGRMPVTSRLDYSWHETPNIHFCTIRDFDALRRELGLAAERRIVLGAGTSRVGLLPNVFGEQAIYLLRRAGTGA